MKKYHWRRCYLCFKAIILISIFAILAHHKNSTPISHVRNSVLRLFFVISYISSESVSGATSQLEWNWNPRQKKLFHITRKTLPKLLITVLTKHWIPKKFANNINFNQYSCLRRISKYSWYWITIVDICVIEVRTVHDMSVVLWVFVLVNFFWISLFE